MTMNSKIVSLNVNSLTEYRRKYLFEQFARENPAIVYLIQETKFGSNGTFSLATHTTFLSTNRPGCGGVALLAHNGLRVRNVKRIVGAIDAVLVDITLGNEVVTIGSVYIHPTCNDISELTGILEDRKRTLIGGDLNARHPLFGDMASNRIGELISTQWVDCGFIVHSPPSPTCYRTATGSYIDKFVSNADFPYTLSGVRVLISFSDHSGISIDCHAPGLDLNVHSGFELRQFNFVSPTKLNNFLERELGRLEMPANESIAVEQLEGLAGDFGDIFARATVKFAPIINIRTNGILLSFRSIALRKRLRTAQRKLHRNGMNGTAADIISRISKEVSALKQMFVNSVGFDLNTHYRSAMANTNSMRDTHKTIMTHTSYRKRSKCPGVIYTDENKTNGLSGPHEIAEGFASRFAENHELSVDVGSDMDGVVNEYADQIAQMNEHVPFGGDITADIVGPLELVETEALLPAELHGILTHRDEIERIVASAPPKRSTGVDLMPYYLLKHLSPNVLLLLTILFNHLLSRSIFPKCWKHSLVTPIPKANKDSSMIANWRPISNLNCISKVFERIMATRLLAHINGINIFETQFGFLRELSTSHALAHLQAAIDDGLNNGKYTTLISLDLRAAFDTVWHSALVFKLGQLRFPLPIVRIIASFLKERTFSVKLNNTITKSRNMRAGTPQGSVCSPILFNLYVHDIPTNEQVKTIQYADDTSLYMVDNNAGRVRNAVNLHLIRVNRYFAKWKLFLNEKKTEVCIFMGFARETNRTMRRAFQNIVFSLNGTLLRPRNKIRLLGLNMNRNNRYVGHVDTMLERARRSFFALRPVLRSQLIETKVRINIYKLYIRPILTYASAIWARPLLLSSHQMERIRMFERMVLRGAGNVRRAVGSFRYTTNAELHRRTNCPRIDRHIVETAVAFFRRCQISTINRIRSILAYVGGTIFEGIATIWDRSRRNELFENDQLLLFHRPYSGANGQVYGTSQ